MVQATEVRNRHDVARGRVREAPAVDGVAPEPRAQKEREKDRDHRGEAYPQSTATSTAATRTDFTAGECNHSPNPGDRDSDRDQHSTEPRERFAPSPYRGWYHDTGTAFFRRDCRSI